MPGAPSLAGLALPGGLAGFGLILAGLYVVTLALYFALGIGISWWNARHAARRIQPGRDGDTRRGIEIRQSMVSILVTCVMVAFGITAQREGWTFVAPLDLGWLSGPAMFLVCMLAFDAWFYWSHRAMHTRWLYPWHRFHHKSVAPTPWSNDAMTSVDTAVTQGFYAVVPFLLPIPPEVLIAHRLYDHFNGTFGHAGFEYFASPLARWPSLMLTTLFHDLHHSGFTTNFGNTFSFWDRLLGTVHPDYDAQVAEWERHRSGPAAAESDAP